MSQLTPLKLRIAVVVLLCCAAIPAFAQKPEKTTIEFSFDIPGFITCNYGPLNASISFTGFEILFYDQAGNLTRLQDHRVITAVVINPLNGKSATGTTVSNETSPFEANQQLSVIDRGLLFRLTIGGRQLPILAGRTIFDVNTFTTVVETPHSILNAETAAAVCAALQ